MCGRASWPPSLPCWNQRAALCGVCIAASLPERDLLPCLGGKRAASHMASVQSGPHFAGVVCQCKCTPF